MSTLTTSKKSINEGERLEFIYFDETLRIGSELDYEIIGCSASDISDEKISGKTKIGSDGKARFYIGFKNDFLTEGTEKIKVSIGDKTLTLDIQDSSNNDSANINSILSYKSSNYNNIQAEWLYSNQGVIYLSFDNSVDKTKRSWWKDVLTTTEKIIEPEFSIVDKNNNLSQLNIYEVGPNDEGVGGSYFRVSSANTRSSTYDYRIEITDNATKNYPKYFGNDLESGWKFVAFHELGHALTLQHPHESNLSDKDELITINDTVMSYVREADFDGNPGFTELDKKALIEIYGAESGQISEAANGTKLLRDTGSYLDNKRSKTPILKMEFEDGNRVCEPETGSKVKRIKFTRSDGNIDHIQSFNFNFKNRSDGLFFTYENTPTWYHDIALQSPIEKLNFNVGEDTIYLDITIYADSRIEEEFLDFYTYNTSSFRDDDIPDSSNPLRLYIDDPDKQSLHLSAIGSYVDEGSNASFELRSWNISTGTKVNYTLSGISANDTKNNILNGEISIDHNSLNIVNIPITNDNLTESNETLTLTINNQSASININDTSKSPLAGFDGTSGNDTFISASSNDLIDGKNLTDTVILSGQFENYSFTRKTNSIKVTDLRTGSNDGTDTLLNIEYIKFTDQTVEESKVDIVKNYSGEFSDYKFYNKGNGVYQIKTDSGYEDITGLPLLTFMEEATTSSFRDISAIVDIKGAFDQVTGLNTDDAKMFRLYNAAFKRLPDADGLKYWIEKYTSGENDDRAVAQSFLVSDEFSERYGANVTNAKYVETLYVNVLGRDYDQEGYNYWLGNLNAGIETRYELLLGFAESAENKTLFTEMTGFV